MNCAGVTQGVRTAQSAVFDHIVFKRERPQDSSMSIPAHFAILAHYSRMRQSHTNQGKDKDVNPLRHLGMSRGDGDGSMVRTWLRKRDDWFTGSREL